MRDFGRAKQEILDRVDLVGLVSEHVRLKNVGRRWVGLCPFHKEKTPSFTVSPELGIFKCFGCGRGGDLFSFVQHMENVEFVDALHLLGDRAGIEVSAEGRQSGDRPSGPTNPRHDILKVNEWAFRLFRRNYLDPDAGRAAREYVRGRGFSEDAAESFGLGLAVGSGPSLLDAARQSSIEPDLLLAADLVRSGESGLYDTFRSRLIFPIHDIGGRVIAFGGRTLVDDRAKYLNSRQTSVFDKGRTLFAIERARRAITEQGTAIVVEGYTDCIAAHQVGICNVVASMGTALTERHVELLRRYGPNMVLLFDSDDAGEAAARRAIELAMPHGVGVRLVRLPPGADPAEFLHCQGKDAFSDALNVAVDALEFMWQHTLDRFDGRLSQTGRREAVVDFLRLVAASCQRNAVDVIQRGLVINQVAHLLQMDRREVDQLARQLIRNATAREKTPAVAGSHQGSFVDAEQAAWTRMLGVLLNEPGLLSTLGAPLDWTRIADPLDRRIGQLLGEFFERFGEIQLADLMAEVSEQDVVARIADLASAGSVRGNFDASFREDVKRIRETEQIRGLDERTRRLVLGGGEPINDEAVESGTVEEGLKRRRHFVPRRLLRQSVPTTDTVIVERADRGEPTEQR